ncbi:MAG: DUF5655 domain-containing protein [Desulfovibrio sp.]|nr:DUF5655 domain-containing protein [Desulfovibrio sp.]
MAAGFIYVLTNPSFPEYVKIGYADDPERRLKEFNRSECLPFAFRLHCTLEVPKRLADKDVHALIDRLNPGLRAVETFDGRPRVREFYNLSAEDAYGILESIATVSGAMDRLRLYASGGAGQADEADVAAAEEAVPPEEASAGRTAQDGAPAVNASPDAAAAWEELNRRVCALAQDVKASPSSRQAYTAFSVQGRRFLAARLQKRGVKLFLGTKGGRLDDPQGLTAPSPWNQEGERQSFIADVAGVDAVMSLVRQALGLARIGRKAEAEAPFTEEALLAAGGPEVASLYASLKERILALGGVSVEPRRSCIAFMAGGRTFLSASFLKSRVRLFLNMEKGTLDDPDGLAGDVSAKGQRWGPGDYQADVADEAELDALMPLIRQAFEAAKA